MEFRTLIVAMAAILASSTASHAAASCTYDHNAAYRVKDGVVVRSGPSESRTAVYVLPPASRAIRCVGPCRTGWCRIRWHGVVGWVPRSDLSEDGTVTYTTDPFP